MTESDVIPQANPLEQYLAHRKQIDAAIQRVLSAGCYVLGGECRSFENEFAEFVGSRYAIGVASGTDALVLALRAHGIEAGDEVITTPHTAVATVAAIELAGAIPVFADIESDTFLISPREIRNVISTRTRAIVPVHLFGQAADLDAILEIARENNLSVIEDCAQAHGARFHQRRVGTFGELGCFSFYPTKNLGAIGDGGMIVTNDENVAERVRALREYGWKQRYISEAPGMNSRLDELQAAVLRVKLSHLDADNELRNIIASKYTTALSGFVTTPTIRPECSSVFHQYVIRTDNRDSLRRHLQNHGIGSAVHYPLPIHLQPAYRGRLGDSGSFPVAEEAAGTILSLPIYPELELSRVNRIIEAIHRQPVLDCSHP